MDFRALTFDEVSARAHEVHSRLEEEAHEKGYAATVTGTEDDDWIKLKLLMEYEGAKTLGDLNPIAADEWAERMSQHARLRGEGT